MEVLRKVAFFTSASALACAPWLGCTSSNSASPTEAGADVARVVSNNLPAADAGTDGDAGGLVHIDRSNLTDAGTTGQLDYSDPNLWICRPGIDPNPCYGDHGELDTTELLPDGGRNLIKHVRATNPKFDCFYVYPTVYLSGNGSQTNLSNVDNVMDALMAQGARMSEMCEVYAPLYRQVMFVPSAPPSMAADAGAADAGSADAGASDSATEAGSADAAASDGGGTLSAFGGSAAALALGDVRAAFKYYLDHFNNGRKFVIMGHSQGTGMLMAMMQTDVDGVTNVQSKMISALLIGGGESVATGQTTGGTFKNIPICTKPGDTGCVVAYSSYDTLAPPGSNALFGHAASGQQTACTNPGTLNNNSGPFKGSYFPTHINNVLLAPTKMIMTDAGTAFVLYRDAFQGNCIVDQNAYSYLQIKLLVQPDDPRGTPPYRNLSAESIGFGLHIVDWNLPMQDLLEVVKAQAQAAGVGP